MVLSIFDHTVDPYAPVAAISNVSPAVDHAQMFLARGHNEAHVLSDPEAKVSIGDTSLHVI